MIESVLAIKVLVLTLCMGMMIDLQMKYGREKVSSLLLVASVAISTQVVGYIGTTAMFVSVVVLTALLRGGAR